ncbi:MAG: hypothetical protein R3200_02360 [Xanthomonadales bacterium]|nr:hypothetical protein [Xanthomonadales bacterium]
MDVWSDASWFLQQIDVGYGRGLLTRMNSTAYRASVFLDQRIAVRDPETRVEDLWRLADEAAARPARPARYIFHVGHCGSTLISRVLQEATSILPLREPVPLRALASMERDLGHPLALLDGTRFDRLSDLLYKLYARTFDDSSLALVKGTSSCTNLLGPVLDHHPQNRALFVYLPLEPFLASLLRADLQRQETARFLRPRLADIHRLTEDDRLRLFDLSPGEMAALNWLGNMLWWTHYRDRHPDRLLAVDFERLLDDPTTTCEHIAAFFGLESDSGGIGEAYRQVTASYSKDPSVRYSRAARDAQLDRCRQEWQSEIDRGLRWIDRQADRPLIAKLLDEAGIR